MCTLSWVPLPEEHGYALAMNRDERRTRVRGIPPTAELIKGVRVMLPRDPEAGGTWVSVNALGLSLALLNRYEDTPHDDAGVYTSRGLLVRSLAHLAELSLVRDSLNSGRLSDYRAFTLACVSPGSSPHLFEWNGRNLDCTVVEAPGLVRASSGSDQTRAEQERGALFREAAQEEWGLTPARLEALHRSHRPVRGPFSICMHRDEAETVSLSLITVSQRQILFRYVDGSPGETSAFIDRHL